MAFINKSKQKGLWYITIFSVLFIMLLYMYNDILVTGWQGKELIDYTVKGKLSSFYFEAISNNGTPPVYSISLYIIFAIWELPVYLLEKIIKADIYFSTLGMIYTKGILVLAIYLCIKKCYEFFKLLKFGDDKADKYALVFLSSLTIITSTCIAVQYDIITVYLILCGMCAWIEKDKKKFLAIFAIAITFKYFAFLYFVPLLLVWEKDIFKLIRDGLIGILPSVLMMLIPKIESSNDTIYSFLRFFFSIKITLFGIPIYLFIVMVLISCLIAYFVKYNSDEDKYKITAVSLFVMLSAFMIVTTGHAFWSVICVPAFIFFLSMVNTRKGLYLLGECMIGIIMAFKHFYAFRWIYCTSQLYVMNILPTIMKKANLVNDVGDAGIGLFIKKMGFAHIDRLLIFVALAIAVVMVLGFILSKKESEEDLDIKYVYIRAIANIIVGYLPLIYSVIYLLMLK